MKEIKAIIQPNRLTRLRDAFRKIPDFAGMSVTRAEGAGYHPGKPHAAGIKGELTEYTQKVRIELVVSDDEVDRLSPGRRSHSALMLASLTTPAQRLISPATNSPTCAGESGGAGSAPRAASRSR